jgi:hypothetical protein
MPSWITDYVKGIDQVSESPIQFNIWSAISVISSIMKRNVFLNYKTFTIYPNQYIVLVGPPGVGKGASIHPAHAFAKDKGLVNYLSDRITAPRILELLFQGFTPTLSVANGQVGIGGKDSSATLMSTELPTLLSSSDWMLQFLCDAWDRGEFEYGTRNKSHFTLTNMCVSLIGACVPDYIRKINKDTTASISSGFSARTIFVNAKVKSKSLPWGEGFKGNPKFVPLITALESRVSDISNLRGEFTLTGLARNIWDHYYMSIDANEDDTDVYKNFKARQHIHVLKTAMALSAAESNSLIITDLILEKAIALIDNIAEGVDEIFRGVGEANLSAAIARLQIYIERKGTVPYPVLVKDNIRHIDTDDIIKVLQVLKLINFVTETNVGGVPHYSHTGQALSTFRKKITNLNGNGAGP